MRKLTDEEFATEVRDILLVEAWPLWPVLPVKNLRRSEPDYPREEEVGILLADNPTTVWIANLFSLKDGEPIGTQLEGVKKIEFDTVDDMVRAGWIGD